MKSRTLQIVHVVDDDSEARNGTTRFLRAAGFDVEPHASAEAFLNAPTATAPGCVVLDVMMPGADGLAVQQTLAARDNPLPVVFLSGKADVSDSVQAMKSGAVDFLTKSADGSQLIGAIAEALARDAATRARRARLESLRSKHDLLSPREREVLAHLISGQLNKQVGFDLGITEQTTKIHRHRVLAKMEAGSIADLVRMAADLGIRPVGVVR
jgi:FixJ family two-component response regulator